MIAEFRKHGRNPRIFACFPVPAFVPVKAPQGVVIANEVIPIIKQVIATQGVSLIDFNKPMLAHGNLFPDGIHPNAEGAKRLAQIAFDTITATTKKADTH
jgi:acyl-CoA thioesterase-1